MFCPECRTESVEGVTLCLDCGLQLVQELPPKPAPEYTSYEQIPLTVNPDDISLMKSILDSEGIVYFFKGEFVTHGHSARLMVRKDQVDEAMEILGHLKDSSTNSGEHEEGWNETAILDKTDEEKVTGNHFFKLTRLALKSYKESNPLDRSRNPRSGFFSFQWGVSIGACEWILTVLLIILAFLFDIICLPFQLIGTIPFKDKIDRERK
jgi:hypothetical protein